MKRQIYLPGFEIIQKIMSTILSEILNKINKILSLPTVKIYCMLVASITVIVAIVIDEKPANNLSNTLV